MVILTDYASSRAEWLCNQLDLKTCLNKMFLCLVLLRPEFSYNVILNLELRSKGLPTLIFLFAEHQISLVWASSYIVACIWTPRAICAAPKAGASARRSWWNTTLLCSRAAKLMCHLKQTAETLWSLKLSKRDLTGVLIKVVFSSWKGT